MPLIEEFDVVFEGIKTALGEQWQCGKADDHRLSGMVTEKVVNLLLNADLVIAVLPDPRVANAINPNVMYELGIAHSFKKPAIVVSDKTNILPFDIRAVESIELDFSRLRGEEQSAIFVKILQDSLQKSLQTPEVIYEIEKRRTPRNPITTQLNSAQVFINDLPWLWSYCKVLNRERAAKTIWEITRDLYWPAESLFYESIRAAIHQKRKHYFIVPREEEVLRKVSRIKKQLRSCVQSEEIDKYLRFVAVEPEKFVLWPISVVLYDADLATSRGGIICEPMTSEVGHDGIDVEIRKQFDDHVARTGERLETFRIDLDWIRAHQEATFDIELDGRVVEKLANAFADIWDEKIWAEIRTKGEKEQSLLKTWLIREIGE